MTSLNQVAALPVLSATEIHALFDYLCGTRKQLPKSLKSYVQHMLPSDARHRGRPLQSALSVTTCRSDVVVLLCSLFQRYYDSSLGQYRIANILLCKSHFCAIVYLCLSDVGLLGSSTNYSDYYRLLQQSVSAHQIAGLRSISQQIASVRGFGKSLPQLTVKDLQLPCNEFTPITQKQYPRWLKCYKHLITELAIK